jgi:putative (di)nucleoside polyphosphate hydrolase
MNVIDSNGYRPNVGIVICNRIGQVMWAKRIGQSAWQFPQGGINQDEQLEDALFRELEEEVGLKEVDVNVLHQTKEWLHYDLPQNYIRQHKDPVCIGQKQKWFLLSLESDESAVQLKGDVQPEFDDWQWVSYWYPISQVIEFKRDVYRRALKELIAPLNSYVKKN